MCIINFYPHNFHTFFKYYYFSQPRCATARLCNRWKFCWGWGPLPNTQVNCLNSPQINCCQMVSEKFKTKKSPLKFQKYQNSPKLIEIVSKLTFDRKQTTPNVAILISKLVSEISKLKKTFKKDILK